MTMSRHSLLKWLTACGVILLAAQAAIGQTGGPQVEASVRDAQSPPKPPQYQGVRYEPVNRRDPFLNPLLLKSREEDLNAEAPRGPAPPGIAGMYIAQVNLLGTSVSDQARTAVFRGTDQRVYFLREGDRLFDGFLKSITVDSAVLTRETKLKSGKLVTQEVTKHLRTP